MHQYKTSSKSAKKEKILQTLTTVTRKEETEQPQKLGNRNV